VAGPVEHPKEVLLDTHALIWWMVDPARLSKEATAALANTGSRVLVAAVVAWELAIKINAGKIQPSSLLLGLDGALAKQTFAELPISLEHAIKAGLLPLHHRDPFDRLLVSQALVLGIPVVSADQMLDAYGIRRIW
jgi:PIN domain nuclease of toxin-antitoxin system